MTSLCRRVGRGGTPLPGGDSEDTLWNPHLPQEGVEAALLRKLVEPGGPVGCRLDGLNR